MPSYCPTSTLVVAIFHCIVTVLITSYCILLFYRFNVDLNKENGKYTTYSKWSGKFIAIVTFPTIIYILMYHIFSFRLCYGVMANIDFLYAIMIPMYTLQSTALMTIFFNRVRHIFGKSVLFVIKKTTVRIYYTVFIILLIWGIYTSMYIGFIQYNPKINPPQIFVHIANSIILVLALTNLSLVIYFISKMIKVHKRLCETKERDTNDFIFKPITKVAILTCVSFISSFGHYVCWVIYFAVLGTNASVVILPFGQFMSMLDVFTNFLCVMLSHKVFDSQYQFLCCCMDKCCKRCWSGIATKDEINMISTIESTCETKTNSDVQV